MNSDLERRVRQLESILDNLVKVGVVSSTNDDAGTARVTFEDQDDVVSYDLPVMVRQSLKNKDYGMPDVGEQVICVFMPTGVEAGYVLGSFYSRDVTPPVATKDKRHLTFSDGTVLEYDREAHRLRADLGTSSIDMNRESVAISVDGISLTIGGGVFAFEGGAVTHNGTTIDDTHTHSQPPDSANNSQAETNPPS